MKQLTQKLGSGEMKIQELPLPLLDKGMILVKNHFSLISAGTESSTVKTARKSLIGKAKERPQQVKQVLDVLRKQGPLQTYRAVQKKLDAYSPLGYSCAGEVIGIGEGITEFNVGDKIACAGIGYANHAEVVSVPLNLCVKLDTNANLEHASYNTLGAIALQGIRQADLRLSETCAVIGLGLLGQLTCLMLRASGIKVIGIDIDNDAVQMAAKNSVDLSLIRNSPGIEEEILEFTNGIGTDAVIIAAATDSLDPINFSGVIARKRGKIIVLGAVPTGFDRDPHYYRKELELKMACSYGPGRYDFNYEEKGQDYPIAYVRWTEKRNMEAFQGLIQSGKIELEYLTTHEFNFSEAPKAYEMVVYETEPFLGITLKYDIQKEHKKEKYTINKKESVGKINIAFIGVGSYAQGSLLPNIPKNSNIINKGILSNNGTSSKRVAEKFNFEFCTDDENDIINSKEINTVFVATRHDSHASYVLKSLKNKKNVFVEKPICLTKKELKKIKEAYNESGKSVMVGYNRRFSPLTQKIKKHLAEGPMSMIYRINAGAIPKDSWIQDMEIGGGRIIGETCHFIDYLTFINGSLPISVSAMAMKDSQGLNDTVNIILDFENGSTGIIAYYANGAKGLPKEYIEINRSGTTAVLSDFKNLSIYSGEKTKRKKLFNQNKGQKEMMDSLFNNLLSNGTVPISFNTICRISEASFAVVESISRSGENISLLG